MVLPPKPEITKPNSHFVLLSSMRYFDRAALFVEACLKYGAFEVSEDTHILCLDVDAEEEANDRSGF